MDSQASQRRIEAAERRTKALELRKAGKTFRQIGAEMGFSEQRAHRIVTAELQRLNTLRTEAAADVARLESERLDVLLAGIWDVAKAGNVEAIGAAIRIMNRRAKLQGLDQPTRRQVTGDGGGPIQFALEDLLVPLPPEHMAHAAPSALEAQTPEPARNASRSPALPR